VSATSRIGIDLVEIAEVADSIDRFGDRYLDRILAEPEREDTSTPVSATRVACAFAAKEAVIKAIGLDASAVPLTAIEISVAARSEWHVTLTGLAEELARDAGILNIALSLSTTRTTVAAVAVAATDVSEGARNEKWTSRSGK
jgi:holo-[acyl-carrier protein] synthase